MIQQNVSPDSCLYVVCSKQVDGDHPLLFWGPANYSQGDFRKLCADLMSDAALAAVCNAQHADFPMPIGMDTILKHLVSELETRDFKLVTPKCAEFYGSCFIDETDDLDILGDSASIVVAYNRSLRSDTIRPEPYDWSLAT